MDEVGYLIYLRFGVKVLLRTGVWNGITNLRPVLRLKTIKALKNRAFIIGGGSGGNRTRI
ncbi:hypothetical protein BWI93_10370 [Siphonobacter sp. BAB-5385]|nr:hypothetical protein BWI93_10370 [Siphonobacter sp. BAB-5385]